MTTRVSILARFAKVELSEGTYVSPYTLHANFVDLEDGLGNPKPAIEASMKWLHESGLEDGKIVEFSWKSEVGK